VRRPSSALGALALATGLLATTGLPASARAAFGPGAIPASALGPELADGASDAPVLSADGRYVVFSTTAPLLLGPSPDGQRAIGGVVRRDLRTGAVDVVAPPQRIDLETGTGVPGGTLAGAAGISADGRWVLFGTTAALDPVADAGGTTPDVYARDMRAPVDDPAAYRLVSARDGSTVGAAYADPAQGSVPGIVGGSLSADGRRAVFVTTGASTLPAAAEPSTPARQVWIRDLVARTTILVSRRRDDRSAAGTPAAAPSGPDGTMPTAAVSADGGTVVWTAGDAELQTPTLPGEPPLGAEPTLLWRRLATPSAPARRVAGRVDLDDPACDRTASYVDDGDAEGPCYGPFAESEGRDMSAAVGTSLRLLGLSGDGRRVLFASSGARRPVSARLTRPGTAFLADMADGLPRKRGVTVAWSAPQGVAGRYPIRGGALSAGGRYGLFASRDVRFDHLRHVGAFPTAVTATYHLYRVDLDQGSVELATVAADGTDYSTGLADLPPSDVMSLSAGGDVLATAVADGNLVVGDANGQQDVLVIRQRPSTVTPPSQRVLPSPAPPALEDAATLAASVAPLRRRYLAVRGRIRVDRRTGTARATLALPVAGAVRIEARGRLVRRVRRGRRTVSRTSELRIARVQRRRARRAGSLRIAVPLTAAARRRLRAASRGVAVRLRLRYEPAGATPTTTSRGYTIPRATATRGGRR